MHHKSVVFDSWNVLWKLCWMYLWIAFLTYIHNFDGNAWWPTYCCQKDILGSYSWVYLSHKYGIELIILDFQCVKSIFISHVWDCNNRYGPLLCQINIHPLRMGLNLSLLTFILCQINIHLASMGLNLSLWTFILCQINIHLTSMGLNLPLLTFIVSNQLVSNQYSSRKYGIELLISMDFYCGKSTFIPQVWDLTNHYVPLLYQINIRSASMGLN